MSQLTLARSAPRAVRPAARPSATQRRDRLRLVDAAPAAGHTGFALLCLALVLAGLMCALTLNMARAESSYVMGNLRSQATDLHDQRVTLEAQLVSVSSPDALAARAADLGLVPSPSTAVLRLSDGAMLGVAAAVDPADRLSVVTHASGTREAPEIRRLGDAVSTAIQKG